MAKALDRGVCAFKEKPRAATCPERLAGVSFHPCSFPPRHRFLSAPSRIKAGTRPSNNIIVSAPTMVSFSSIKKRLHQIRSHRPTKLNPDYHTSPYTTLSAQQFRSESARKTHAKTHGHPVTSGKPTSKGAAGANDADSSHVVEAR